MSHENLNNGKFYNFCVNQIYLDVCHDTQWRFKIKTKLLICPFRFWIRLGSFYLFKSGDFLVEYTILNVLPHEVNAASAQVSIVCTLC